VGMFDYIRCKYPLPVADTQDLQFQTKDTDKQFLEVYEIREDGSLWVEEVARQWVDDESWPLKGYMKRITQTWRPEMITGEIRFGASHGPKTIGGIGENWIEYSAYFENGKLSKLNLIEDRRTAKG
jgi:hypothetical protein